MNKAKKLIQDFADKNEITSESEGHGYGSLTVNGKEHGINPYGIDVKMMLEYCGIDEAKLNEEAASGAGPRPTAS